MKDINVKLTFIEPVLGSSPSNEDLYYDYVGSKAPDATTIEDEVESLGVDGVVEKGMTIFPKNEEGKPFLYDYQVKGFFKDTCGGLRKVPGTESSKIKAFKKEIDKLIFAIPRRIVFENVTDTTTLQRPLRAQTAQGERISLAISEVIPAGATVTFTIRCLLDGHEKAVREWLDYGKLSGLGQWRNSGMGRFTWEEIKAE